MNNNTLFYRIFLNGIRPVLWLTFIIYLFYFQTLFFSFSPLDDPGLIESRMEELQDFHTIGKVFTSRLEMANAALLYRPILELTFMVDAITGQGSPFSFHLSNVFYHLIAVLLVFQFLLLLKIERKTAFICTIIFAIHPVNVSIASWIPARNDSLLAIFLIASLITYLKYLNLNSNRWLVAHFLLYGIALFTKENAVVIPPLIITYIILFPSVKRKKLGLQSVIWAVITLFWLWMRSSPQGDFTELPFREQIFTNTVMNFILYMGKVFFPRNLSLMPNTADTPMISLFIATALFIVIAMLLKKKNYRLAIWGITFFIFVIIIPLLWGTVFGLSVSYEHRTYLPFVGLLIFITQLQIPEWIRYYRKYLWLMLTLIIFILGVKSFYRIQVYRDKDIFTFSVVIEAPSQWQAYALRADALVEAELFLAAVNHYSKAIDLIPNHDEDELYYAIGNCYQRMEYYSKALENYELHIEKHPDFPDVFFNRALIYRDQGDYLSAIPDITTALTLEPENSMFLNERGFCYQKIQEYEKSITDFDEGLRYQPNDINMLNNRSVSYFMLHEFEKAKAGILHIETLGGQVHPNFKESVLQKCGN